MAGNRPEKNKPVLLIALGGNALIRKGQRGTVEEQFANLRGPIRQLAALTRRFRLVITHGNGPQVGHLLRQQEGCDAVPRLPLEILVAQTQGQIGYMIESSLDTALMDMGGHPNLKIVSLISYVVVDEKDPAFQNPSKPIGPAYPTREAAGVHHPVMATSRGYRRAVVSPRPVTIVEKREIKALIEMGFIVICCGGGGIPVIREGRSFSGVDAVIDKDLASARLAGEIGVDLFMIATDVPGAALHFGRPEQTFLGTITVDEAERYQRQGQFAAGAMGPKLDAAVQFARNSGKCALITAIDQLQAALDGKAGTVIAPAGADIPVPDTGQLFYSA